MTFLFGVIVKWRKQQDARRLNFWSKLRDTARYAAFLATYSGTFVAVDEGIAALFGKRRYNLAPAAPAASQVSKCVMKLYVQTV